MIINIYSKSDNKLGRDLSNFAHTPFYLDGNRFESVEAWWYWYSTGKQYHHLKQYYGFRAKQEGKKYPKILIITPEILIIVYRAKITQNAQLRYDLMQYKGSFDHYYMYGEKKVPADNWLWTAKLWEKVRDELIKNKEICPRCNGTAKSVDYISWLNEFKEIPCYLCKGTGNVIKGER